MLEKHPERLIEKAVKGMLPKNTLGRAMGKKLKVYAGPEHPHAGAEAARRSPWRSRRMAETRLSTTAPAAARPRSLASACVPGTGAITVNEKTGAGVLRPRRRSSTFVETPFKVTETVGRFDVIAQCHGGGVSGQAGALRHGIARALLEAGDEYRGELKNAGLPAPRPAYGRAQEVRPEEGPQEPQFSKR